MDKPLSREGHRQRMRATYLAGGMENAPDHNLLELYLSLFIAQKDVKELSYSLINEFGSLGAVINASPDDLMRVNGIGEVSAVAISMIKTITKRIDKNKNKGIREIHKSSECFEYCKNILKNEKVEKVLEITLNGDGTVINDYIVGTGVVNSSPADTRIIVANAVKDNAAAVILAHNHPDGIFMPSANDINFTISIKATLKAISIELLDHVIVCGDKADSIYTLQKL